MYSNKNLAACSMCPGASAGDGTGNAYYTGTTGITGHTYQIMHVTGPHSCIPAFRLQSSQCQHHVALHCLLLPAYIKATLSPSPSCPPEHHACWPLTQHLTNYSTCCHYHSLVYVFMTSAVITSINCYLLHWKLPVLLPVMHQLSVICFHSDLTNIGLCRCC